MEPTRALVTGASAGIGRAVCTELAAWGVDLVVVARDGERLEALAAELVAGHRVDVEVLPADLLDDTDRRRVEQRLAEAPDVDLLVNNAGIGSTGSVASLPVDGAAAMLELNVVAAQRLASVAAQVMRPRGRGGILNVSSLASFQPGPGSATYAASKAFLTSLSEAMHLELAPHGVHVTALCPGYTRTEFHERGGIDVRGVPGAMWSTPRQVAVDGLDGVAANRAVVVPGAANKVVAGITGVLPRGLLRAATDAVTGRLLGR